MNIVTVGAIVLKLFPAILKCVRDIEEAHQLPNAGAAKREAVLGFIRTIYEADPTQVVKFDDLVGTITKVINTVVTFYNTSGVFKKAK